MSYQEIDHLIDLARSDNKNDRRTAAQRLPELVLKLPKSEDSKEKAKEVLSTLTLLSSDKDRKTKSNAEKGRSIVEKFVRDLEQVESSQSETETKKQTASEISSGLKIRLEESMEGVMSYEGEYKDIKTSGTIKMENEGEKDRIFDINLIFADTGNSDLEQEYHINEIQPGETHEITYKYEWGGEKTPLTFKEIIDTAPETEEPSNVLVFGQVMETKLTYQFESKQNIASMKMLKTLPAGFSNVSIESSSVGSPTIVDDKLEWLVENIEEGQSGELVITGSFKVDNLEEISTGEIKVEFTSSEELFSFLKINQEELSASTRSKFTIESNEQEEKPDYWLSKVVFENKSEFPVKIRKLSVKDEEQEYWALSDEIIVNAGETWESVEWESFSETIPRFETNVDLTVGISTVISSQASLILEETQLVVANIEGEKQYVTPDGQEISVINSYRETEIPAVITLNNIGKVPYDNIVITDTTPADFLPPKPESLSIVMSCPESGEEALSEEDFEYSYAPEDEEISSEHITTVKILKQMDPDCSLKINYAVRAVRPLPEKEYKATTKVTAQLVEKAPPLELEFVEKQPKLIVVHQRRKVSVGKDVLPGANKGEYEVIMHFKNRGNYDLKDLVLKDFVSDDFEYSNFEIKRTREGEGEETLDIEPKVTSGSVKDVSGDILEFAFDEIKEGTEVVISYRIVGKDPDAGYKARNAQLSFV